MRECVEMNFSVESEITRSAGTRDVQSTELDRIELNLEGIERAAQRVDRCVHLAARRRLRRNL
jgi:hypothetical protein